MKKPACFYLSKTRRFIFYCCLLGLLSPALRAQTVESKVPATISTDAASIEKLIQSQLAQENFVGSSVAVAYRGKIIFAKGYGKRSLASNKAVDAETVFNVGSVSKQFTSAAVLLLAEEGKLSVGDKVAEYFPQLTRADEITLLDLMQHVAGYPDYYPLDFLDRRMLAPVTPDRIIDTYATRKLDFEPRTQHSYSNTGYVILGRVVEKVSGQSLERFLAERFFKPLKMKSTVFEPRKRGRRFADGYTSYALSDAEPAQTEGRGWGSGAGGVFSTATDLAKWNLALMEGKVLKPETLKLMTTRVRLRDGREKDYGCGVEIFNIAGDTVVTHGGATSGFTARNTMIPSTGSAIVILSNTDFALPGSILHGKFLRAVVTPQPVDKEAIAVKNQPSPSKPAVPQVGGIPAADAARLFFLQMQAGSVDRALLGEEFGYFLNDSRVKNSAVKLKSYGAPLEIKILDQSARGGMEATSMQFIFSAAKLNGFMYRSTDGKIQGFSIRR